MKKFLLLLIISASVANAEVSLEEYKGKVVYVDFWASWCAPCLASFPWLNHIHEKYKSKNFAVVGVNLDKKREKADDFLVEKPARFPLIFDPEGVLPKKYQVEGMPYSVIIDEAGKVVHRHSGFESAKTAEYEKAIEEVLTK